MTLEQSSECSVAKIESGSSKVSVHVFKMIKMRLTSDMNVKFGPSNFRNILRIPVTFPISLQNALIYCLFYSALSIVAIGNPDWMCAKLHRGNKQQ